MRPALALPNDLTDKTNDEDDDMGLEYIVTGIIALLVGVYLMIALLRPDKF
jgi:K+-transporting ATPase KdpF subunit